MSRKLNAGGATDSLELLLDTLCNMFGGIVLIACLLAILPRQQMPPPLAPTHAATAEMTERRIITATEEIKRLESDIERLSISTDPKIAALQSRRDSINKLLEKLLKDHKESENLELDEAEIRAIAAKADPKVLEERLYELKSQKSKIENLNAATTDKVRFLEQRKKNLSEESETLAKGKFQAVRFPRERAAKSSPFAIIVRYNQVYPLLIGEGDRLNPAIIMNPIADDSFHTAPIPGRGIVSPDEDPNFAATLKAVAGKKKYLSIYLYPDSHGVFSDLTEAMAKAGISYGIEFVATDKELNFGAEGSSPPEL